MPNWNYHVNRAWLMTKKCGMHLYINNTHRHMLRNACGSTQTNEGGGYPTRPGLFRTSHYLPYGHVLPGKLRALCRPAESDDPEMTQVIQLPHLSASGVLCSACNRGMTA